MEHVNVPGTVLGRLPSSAPRVKSIHKDDNIRQRHLHVEILKVQGTSTFAIANPECLIRRDKATNHEIICMYSKFSTGPPQTLT